MEYPEPYQNMTVEDQYTVLSYWAREYPEKGEVSENELISIIEEAL